MTILKGPEAIEVAVANTLQTYLPAVVNAIYAAAADSVPNVLPVQYYAGARDVIPEYPAIVVASIQGDEVVDGSPVWGEVNHHFDVSVLCQSDDHRTLDIQNIRLLWAIWDTLKQHQGLDGSLNGLAGLTLARYGRSQVYRDNSKHFLQAAAWEVIVRVEENTF